MLMICKIILSLENYKIISTLKQGFKRSCNKEIELSLRLGQCVSPFFFIKIFIEGCAYYVLQSTYCICLTTQAHIYMYYQVGRMVYLGIGRQNVLYFFLPFFWGHHFLDWIEIQFQDGNYIHCCCCQKSVWSKPRSL